MEVLMRRRIILLTLTIISLFIVFTSNISLAQAPEGYQAVAVVLQADGKIIELGEMTIDAKGYGSLIRYNSDGSIDTSFGNNGRVTLDYGGMLNDFSAIEIVTNKIIVVGDRYILLDDAEGNPIIECGNSGNGAMMVISSNTLNGATDNSFGNEGLVLEDSNSEAVGTGIIPQNNNDLLIIGNLKERSCDAYQFVARYNINGSLDRDFGDLGGYFAIKSFRGTKWFVVQSPVDNSIYLLDTSGTRIRIYLYDVNGRKVDGFGGEDGNVTRQIARLIKIVDVKVQADGKVLLLGEVKTGADQGGGGIVGGSSERDIVVARLNLDASFDNTFGEEGIVKINLGNDANGANTFTIQSDGKIVVVGDTFDGETRSLAVVRLMQDGSIDNSFGDNGRTLNECDGICDPKDVAVQENGEIVVVSSDWREPMPMKFSANGSEEASFSQNSKAAYTSLTASEDGEGGNSPGPEGGQGQAGVGGGSAPPNEEGGDTSSSSASSAKIKAGCSLLKIIK